jgi:hypothetical protein
MGEGRKIKKNNRGRKPKPVKDRIEEKHFDMSVIEQLAVHGLTDKELAVLLKVDERTINRWKKDPEFLSVLKNGKLKADIEVQNALFKRSIGFEYEEIHQEGTSDGQGGIKPKSMKKVKKYYPPDTAAAFIWLKNRRGWKDKQELDHKTPIPIKFVEDLDE